jgi:hypothetical protein
VASRVPWMLWLVRSAGVRPLCQEQAHSQIQRRTRWPDSSPPRGSSRAPSRGCPCPAPAAVDRLRVVSRESGQSGGRGLGGSPDWPLANTLFIKERHFLTVPGVPSYRGRLSPLNMLTLKAVPGVPDVPALFCRCQGKSQRIGLSSRIYSTLYKIYVF